MTEPTLSVRPTWQESGGKKNGFTHKPFRSETHKRNTSHAKKKQKTKSETPVGRNERWSLNAPGEQMRPSRVKSKPLCASCSSPRLSKRRYTIHSFHLRGATRSTRRIAFLSASGSCRSTVLLQAMAAASNTQNPFAPAVIEMTALVNFLEGNPRFRRADWR